MNANDATLTELATAQSGSMVADNAPNAVDLTAVNQGWPRQVLVSQGAQIVSIIQGDPFVLV